LSATRASGLAKERALYTFPKVPSPTWQMIWYSEAVLGTLGGRLGAAAEEDTTARSTLFSGRKAGEVCVDVLIGVVVPPVLIGTAGEDPGAEGGSMGPGGTDTAALESSSLATRAILGVIGACCTGVDVALGEADMTAGGAAPFILRWGDRWAAGAVGGALDTN
jgi:hypothetical protein